MDTAGLAVAYVISDGWNVHSGDRYRLMFTTKELRRREQAFLGATAMTAFGAVRHRVGLVFFGADFALAPSGELILFECNAAMRHNFDHTQAFPYTRKTLHAVSTAFQAMVQRKLGRDSGCVEAKAASTS